MNGLQSILKQHSGARLELKRRAVPCKYQRPPHDPAFLPARELPAARSASTLAASSWAFLALAASAASFLARSGSVDAPEGHLHLGPRIYRAQRGPSSSWPPHTVREPDCNNVACRQASTVPARLCSLLSSQPPACPGTELRPACMHDWTATSGHSITAAGPSMRCRAQARRSPVVEAERQHPLHIFPRDDGPLFKGCPGPRAERFHRDVPPNAVHLQQGADLGDLQPSMSSGVSTASSLAVAPSSLSRRAACS